MEWEKMEPMVYFAYGRNMALDVITEIAPSAKLIGPGRADGYRIRFGRRSVRTNTGVADIAPAEGFAVHGILYSVNEADLGALDRREGVKMSPPAYERRMIKVVDSSRQNIAAWTYRVTKPETIEVPPSREYLQSMITGAREGGLSPNYVRFLEWLQHERATNSAEFRRQGMLVRGNYNRVANSIGIVRVNPSAVPSSAKAIAITSMNRTAIADVIRASDVPEGACDIDQSIRYALGIRGTFCYGHTARVMTVDRRFTPSLLQPRSLCLPLHQPNVHDGEKQVCVLHPRNIAFLGLDEGDHVLVYSAINTGGRVETRRVRLRVFGGTMPRANQSGRVDYPRIDEVYVDADARQELGFPRLPSSAYLEHPLLVVPDVSRLARRRGVPYAVTLFVGVASLTTALASLAPTLPIWIRGALSLVLPLAITFLLALVELRGRLQR